MQHEHINPVLAETWRGGMVENQHRGAWCLVDASGRLIAAQGYIHDAVYPRSALKFFQALPLVENGGVQRFGLTPAELAVICASHNAETFHLEAVQSILIKAGVKAGDLDCGAHYPMYEPATRAMWHRGEEPSALHNNCSGKHAGFLALCRLLNADISGYLDPGHPIQLAIRACLAEMTGFPSHDMVLAIDGCSAPVYGFPLFNMALGFARLGIPAGLAPSRAAACRQLTDAVTAHPEMVAGTGRYCTDLMKTCDRKVLAKVGAEGVFGISFLEQGIGLAIKIDDGKMGPQYAVAQQIVEASGLFTADKLAPLRPYLHQEVLNWSGIHTGVTRSVAEVPDQFIS